jgi:N-acetylglucosamine-6-phosphate deacetylase
MANSKMNNRLAIIGGAVVTPQIIITPGLVLCEAGRIRFIGSASEAQPDEGSQIIDATGCLVLPGLIDTHFHGSHGDDVMANGADGIRRIARAILRYGHYRLSGDDDCCPTRGVDARHCRYHRS